MRKHTPRNAFLIGRKVYLRALEETDLTICHEWFSDPDVRRTLNPNVRMRPTTEASSRAWFDAMDRTTNAVFAIVTRDEGAYIGNCGLHAIDAGNRHAELGIAIGRKDHWGRGYGSDTVHLLCRFGFEGLNLHRIWLPTYSINDRAMRVYERIGFRTEGRLREHEWIEGRWVDLIMMGLLQSDLRAPVSKITRLSSRRQRRA